MGGIKNKLSKLSNKVKNLFNSLPLAGRADEMTKSSQSREGNSNKDSRLPSFSQSSKMPDGQISNTRKSNYWGLYASKTIGSLRPTSQSLPLAKGRQMSVAHRWGRITKYTCTACLTLAILSTLALNIISSYSSSSTRSNAEPVGEVSTLANNNNSSTCNPSNTNAPSCISMSISSYPSATGDTNDGNLSLSIPQGGGLVAGRHTASVKSNNVSGVELQAIALGDTSYPQMIHESNNDYTIDSLPYGTSSTNFISYSTARPIANNTYGLAIPDSSLYGDSYDDVSAYESYIANPRQIASTETAPKFAGLYNAMPHGAPATRITFFSTPTIDRISQPTPVDGYNLNIYYGVRVDNPNELLAGNYQAEVVYTVTTNPVEAPTVDSMSPTSYELGSNTNLDSNNRLPVTITGTNLKSTYKVYLENNTDSNTNYDLTSNITSVSDTELKVALPTDKTNSNLEAGEYTIHVVTQGGEAGIPFEYKEKPIPVGSVCANADSSSACVVDMDANMIPIYYTGDDNSPEWTSLSDDDTQNTPSAWYNYGEKKWANAVTVKPEALTKYKNQHTKIDENDVLGYWVYIPRYAYEVMRRDAGDLVIMDTQAASEGGFQIKFETAETVKKQPQSSCSDPDNGKYIDYRTGCGISREYGSSTGTTWGTHPAFSWVTDYNSMGSQYKELNGFWVGKFETSGSMTNLRILPNQYHKTVYYVGEYYSLARKLGVDDPNNRYGNDADASNNYHNLITDPSHMIKNSEWGAVTYLSSSVYGAGVNGVQPNTSADGNDGWGNYSGADGDGNDTYGITGCGPSADGNTGSYDCSGDPSHQYQSKIGQLASTTGNVYGVYDMSGGADELVAAVRTNMYNQAPSFNITYAPTRPYVDLYEKSAGFGNKKPSWSWSSGAEAAWNNEVCTWETCGGHALVETTNRQVMYRNQGSWGNGDASFAYLEGNRGDLPWFERGLGAYEATIYSYGFSGGVDSINHRVLAGNALRVVVADTL